jgi:hypothetical protein
LLNFRIAYSPPPLGDIKGLSFFLSRWSLIASGN